MVSIMFVPFGGRGCLGSAFRRALCMNFVTPLLTTLGRYFIPFITRRVGYSVHCGRLWLNVRRCRRRRDLTNCQIREEKRRVIHNAYRLGRYSPVFVARKRIEPRVLSKSSATE